MRTTLVLAALALSAPSNAENWAKIGTTGQGEALHVDLDSVAGQGSSRTLRYKTVATDGYSVVTVSLDCAAQNFALQRMETYTADGMLLDSMDGPFPTADIEPGSTPAVLHQVVCH